MLSVASIFAVVSASIFIMSVVCITTLPPDSTSSDEPAGIGTFFSRLTVSFVSVSLVSDTSWTSTVCCVVPTLQSIRPRTTEVVELGQVYNVSEVPAEAGIAACVFTLNVLAMFYPNAIANAVAVFAESSTNEFKPAAVSRFSALLPALKARAEVPS